MSKRLIACLLLALALSPTTTYAELNLVKFIGIAQSFQQRIGGSSWLVRVERVISGPQPCAQEIRVVTWTSAAPPIEWGYTDSEIKPNDRVYVYGRYVTDPFEESGCFVTLEWTGFQSPSLYFIRLPIEVVSAEIALSPAAPTTADEITLTVRATFSKEFSNECFAAAQLSNVKRQGNRFVVTAWEIWPEIVCILIYRPTRTGQRTYSLGRLAPGTYTVELQDFSRVAQSVTFTVTQAGPLSVERALDEDNNNRIDDPEIIRAINLWIRQQPVPETGGQVINDATIIRLLNLWIRSEPIR
ncbi:MAG: hypothetical protein RML48_07595 [Candidatus Bipolaricaulota bacterium]|nr:hypothetical protein [Candidatus Bipolaricaulota bacterium]MDW8141201.1 hypothetical protein [Candidatus Bipolaricaulota bacterium]MDW8329823.1 hypothetical protein [Candidatus Bipolaricaulota bacterium]